jgi:hypothetical protein
MIGRARPEVPVIRRKAEVMKMSELAARAAGLTVVGMIGVSLVVTAGTAGAAKRDVIADADRICQNTTANPPANLLDACRLQRDTRDPTVAEFSGKPRDGQNLDAQSRKASSVVLSLDDVYTRGKTPSQVQAAIDDACAYAAKSAELVTAHKVIYADDRDLGEDATHLAAAITAEFELEYDIFNPCAR